MRFRTSDKRFGLSIQESTVRRLLRLCRSAGITETGGILAGYYSERRDCAIVTYASGPPRDSRRTRTTFYRGVKGLQHYLNRAWVRKHEFYLGEWHYHPYASGEASAVDARQLRDFSEDGALACLEPVMLIIGGDPAGAWEAKAYVHPNGEQLYTMLQFEPAVRRRVARAGCRSSPTSAEGARGVAR